MAYDEDLVDRVRAALGAQVVTEKKMFGGLAFLVGGHLAIAAGAAGLMVRVDPEDTGALLEQPGVERVEMRGRSMRGWLRVSPDRLRDDATLDVWVRRGVGLTGSLAPER